MASIAFTSVWSFEMAVPIVSTMVPPELRLKSCSRWPEKADCRQECLAEIELSQESAATAS